QVSTHTKGIFFFKQSRINHPLKQFPTETQEVVAQQGFIRYYHLDNEKHLVAGSAYEDFNNIETELLQVIEQKVGQKRIVKNLTNEEQKLQNWINQQSVTKNGNGSGSIVEYTIANPSLTGSFNEFLEFDINIASLLSSEEFFSGELLIDYNTLTFGSNLAASGIVNITKGNVILTPNYTITITDVSASKLKIEVVSSSNNPNTLYLIDNTAEQLVHLKIDITNLAGNTGIEFDELNMQGASEFFDISSNVVEPFELVKADDELDVDINALVVPTIIDFYPKTVRGGIDTITIIGTGFGIDKNSGRVEFINAHNGPNSGQWIHAHHYEYPVWNDTEIKVIVTSLGDINGNLTYPFGNYYAGTGAIRVVTDNGQTSLSSTDILNVKFSIATKRILDNGLLLPKPILLIDGNNNGGYTLTLDTSFTNDISFPGAQEAFERALITWRCNVGVNFSINDTFPNVPSGNEIIVKFNTPLNGAIAATGEWIIPDCNSVSNTYLRKFSIQFSRAVIGWYTGVSTATSLNFFEFDLETHALHELGHTIQLNHTNDVSSVMWWEARIDNTDPFYRDLDTNTLAGGLYMMDISAVNPPQLGTCQTPMSLVNSVDCDFTNSTDNYLISELINIFPNPVSNILTIESQINKPLAFFITDVTGRVLINGDLKQSRKEVDLSMLSSGFYFLSIHRENLIYTTKIIKTP
ncbi:MAG: T9SS type A sorting domain-containing protein, partial [Saprospiraceae bacterium]